MPIITSFILGAAFVLFTITVGMCLARLEDREEGR